MTAFRLLFPRGDRIPETRWRLERPDDLIEVNPLIEALPHPCPDRTARNIRIRRVTQDGTAIVTLGRARASVNEREQLVRTILYLQKRGYTLRQMEAVTGYSYGHLGKLLRSCRTRPAPHAPGRAAPSSLSDLDVVPFTDEPLGESA